MVLEETEKKKYVKNIYVGTVVGGSFSKAKQSHLKVFVLRSQQRVGT